MFSKYLSHLTLGENWYELGILLDGDIVQHFLHYFIHYFHPTGGDVPQHIILLRPMETSLSFREHEMPIRDVDLLSSVT